MGTHAHMRKDAIHVVLHSSFSALRRESFGGNHSVFRGKGRLVVTNRILRGGITKLTTNEGEGHKNATKPCGGIK